MSETHHPAELLRDIAGISTHTSTEKLVGIRCWIAAHLKAPLSWAKAQARPERRELYGLWTPARWKPGVNEAVCFGKKAERQPNFPYSLNPPENYPPTPPPHLDIDHSCGFYAYRLSEIHKSRLGWVSYFNDSRMVAVEGVVRLWGTVIEYERGYRAQFAEVAALVRKTIEARTDPMVEQVAEDYGVPCYDTLEEAIEFVV